MTIDTPLPTEKIEPATTPRWLRSLDEIDGTDLPWVGGKAFRLATLRQNGLNVPPGLVLTTLFFEAQIKHTKLTPLWMGSPDIAVTTDSLNWLADTLKITPITKVLAEALQTRLETLFWSANDTFAVRSSAIDEDQRSHTFAGIHLTELGVPRSSLPIAITRCWASALNETALQYRRSQGLSIQGIRIAVLIQPMLKPDCAGVGFTVNPLTGNRDEFVIEATQGLGEALVSGTIQPYFYKLANQPPGYPLIEQQAGHPSSGADTEPLQADELPQLALQLAQVQALMGEPQDIEWAKEADTFYILQSRPVALPPQSDRIADLEWTRGSHPENLPELPSPFFSSLFIRSQDRAIIFFQELGLTVTDLGPYLKLIMGRPYLNLTFLKRIIAQVGLAPGQLLYTIGHPDIKNTGRGLSIDGETALKMWRVYAGVFKHLLSNQANLKRYQAVVDEAVEALQTPDFEAESAVLLGQLRQQERIFNELFPVNLGIAGVMSALMAVGSSLMSPMNLNPATLLTALAQRNVTTTEGGLARQLAALGRLADQDPGTRQYFLDAPADFADYTKTTAICAEFRAAFDQLLTEFGERAAFEADPGQPRYQEEPASLLRAVRQHVLSGAAPTPKATSISWQSLTEAATGLNRWLPWQRWLARPFVILLKRQMWLREAMISARARAVTTARRWDLALGQHWVAGSWLAQPGDIFWLTIEEIEQALIAGEAMGMKLSSVVRARRENYATYAETPMPFQLHENQIFSIEPGQGLQTETAEVLVGLPISPGQVRARVQVLRSPEDFKPTDQAMILVTPTTDPSWLPLLHHAAGLIVEMGGLLSHGSVIAREYGLPGVANIPDATRRFRDGEVVLLDGSTGVVQRLESN